MARYQKKPSIADLAARRNQTVAQLIADWAIASHEELVKRCQREGVTVPSDITLSLVKPTEDSVDVKVEVATEPAVKAGKKHRKGKVTLDEPAASHEHDGVDPVAPAGSEDPA